MKFNIRQQVCIIFQRVIESKHKTIIKLLHTLFLHL